MGMAFKPPPELYERKFLVISHASNERYRERFVGTGLDHLDEHHLANHIDWATVGGFKAGLAVPILEDGNVADIVPIDPDEKLWSLVRANKKGPPDKIILTVLTRDQVCRSFSANKWVRIGDMKKEEKIVNVSGKSLDKLKLLKKSVEESTDSYRIEFSNGKEFVHKKADTELEAERIINEPPIGFDFVSVWKRLDTSTVVVTKIKA